MNRGWTVRRIFILWLLLPLQFALADEVVLTSGEILQCQIIEQTAQLVIVDHPILGRLEISAANVQKVVTDAKTVMVPETQPKEKTESKPPTAPLPKKENEKPKPKWKSKIELGFGGSNGNTEDANATFAFKSKLDRGFDNYTFDTRYSIRSSQGDRSENKLTAGLLAQWPLPDSRWNYFAQGRYDADEFQSWDARATGGAGIGYHLIDFNKTKAGKDIDVFDLNVKAGLGFLREFGSDNERMQPEGILGTDLTWQISPRQKLAGKSTYYPNFDENGEFRLVSSAEWILALDTFEGLSLKLGLLHEYQSQVDEGIKHSDISIYGAIVLEF